ncbi:MAG: filamentous hemagglutinin N-terminal domain-containing protein, partial [Cyanobacteria bacterium J06635_10]
MFFHNWHWKLTTQLVIWSTVFSTTNTAHAQQVIPDNTLPNNSVVNLENNITNITGGTQRGGNLFHSFERFGVTTRGQVNFNNTLDINNIINRVTGGNVSNIDGLIRANGAANLFLINPAGIVFGENAQLNIGGSFIGSTADAIWFGENNFFSAINPENTPLLSINVPLGLQYGANPGNISVTGKGETRQFTEAFDPPSGLRVPDSKTLALIGGNVLLEGATLKAGAGRIELGSVAQSGVVSIEAVEKGFSFGFDELENFGEIQLSQITAVDATGNGAGDVRVTGKNLTLTDSSVISSTQTGTEKSAGIVVDTTESVEINGINDTFVVSGLYANNISKNVEETGNITINTQQLTVRDGATVTTNAFNGAAKGGDINIAANNFRIEAGGKVSAATFNVGNGGNLNIDAENVEVVGTANNG